MADFARLSANWYRWAAGIGGGEASVSTDCDDCEILFDTDDYSVHLRHQKSWWVVGSVDDRGRRHSGVAKLSNFCLPEKFRIWHWVTMANANLASGQLGAELYRQGYAPGVEVTQLDAGNVEICSQGDCAILVVGSATIFSHIMQKSVEEIEAIARSGSN